MYVLFRQDFPVYRILNGFKIIVGHRINNLVQLNCDPFVYSRRTPHFRFDSVVCHRYVQNSSSLKYHEEFVGDGIARTSHFYEKDRQKMTFSFHFACYSSSEGGSKRDGVVWCVSPGSLIAVIASENRHHRAIKRLHVLDKTITMWPQITDRKSYIPYVLNHDTPTDFS